MATKNKYLKPVKPKKPTFSVKKPIGKLGPAKSNPKSRTGGNVTKGRKLMSKTRHTN